MSAIAAELPGLVAGTWALDPTHSDISFSVRHLMVSKVRGTFTRFSGELRIAEDLFASAATASVDMTSIDTREQSRDEHLRTNDFFAADKFPTMTWRSTGIRRSGDDWVVDGELTLRGVTRPVPLEVEFHGVTKDPWGGTRAGFSAEAEINRKDFGVSWNAAVDGGGVVVGDKVKIHLEVEAILQEL